MNENRDETRERNYVKISSWNKRVTENSGKCMAKKKSKNS